MEIKYTRDQENAWNKIKAWLDSNHAFFVLKGFSGSGKTTLMRRLSEIKDFNFIYSAPTNKATKVLSMSIGQPAKTTYSVFGLRMVSNEDKLVLEHPKIPPVFASNTIIIIDEASMVGKELHSAVVSSQQRSKLRIIYVGDPAQLPPVKEYKTEAWEASSNPEDKALLKQIVRYDNNLLSLATDIRNCIKSKNWYHPVLDYAGTEGIEFIDGNKFINKISNNISNKLWDFQNTKVIAWRNKTVNYYNSVVRQARGFSDAFNVGDFITLKEPVEENNNIIATTDDEFIVDKILETTVNIGIANIDVIQLSCISVDNNMPIILNIPINVTNLDYNMSILADYAKRASSFEEKRLAWNRFWTVKKQFHSVLFSYALTAHRSQGSTYKTVYIDQSDILANSNTQEAFRCLYVAVTRASENIVVC